MASTEGDTVADVTSNVMTLEELARYHGAPLYLFVGIQTSGSRVHELFPRWSAEVGLDAVLRGIDLPEDTSAETYRELVVALRDNPSIHGAVVTSHKLRLYQATSQLLTSAEPLVELTHEINSLDVRDGVRAFARDAQSLEVLFRTNAGLLGDRPEVLCLGSGGSAIALMLALGLDLDLTVRTGDVAVRAEPLAPLTIVGRREAALQEVHEVARRAGLHADFPSLRLAASADQWDELVSAAGPGSLVINATGLGKLSVGSPVTGSALYPSGALAWDFNYRGPLTFLGQAREQSVDIEDGWEYFLAGWSCALAAITDRDAAQVLAGVTRVS